MNIVVLDASAMLAFLRGELGGTTVLEALLSDSVHCVAHAINVCEVYYDILRTHGALDADRAIEQMKDSGLTISEAMDEAFWKALARRKAAGRISLADCCGLALAEKTAGAFYTADRHEMSRIAENDSVRIVFIR